MVCIMIIYILLAHCYNELGDEYTKEFGEFNTTTDAATAARTLLDSHTDVFEFEIKTVVRRINDN